MSLQKDYNKLIWTYEGTVSIEKHLSNTPFVIDQDSLELPKFGENTKMSTDLSLLLEPHTTGTCYAKPAMQS
jgi:hypothetical protein